MPADDSMITLTRADWSNFLRVVLYQQTEAFPKQLHMRRSQVQRLIDNPSLPVPPRVVKWFTRPPREVA